MESIIRAAVVYVVLLVATLVGMNILFSVVATRWRSFQKVIEDVPLVILEDGKPLEQRMRKERVEENEILEAARANHGLERLDQIKYAILERTGRITIVPR
jgi:uncharacterized membrane protein YcaP (DUF421 family)